MSQTITVKAEDDDVQRNLVFHNPEVLKRLLEWMEEYNHWPINLSDEIEDPSTITAFVFASHNVASSCNLKYQKLCEELARQ